MGSEMCIRDSLSWSDKDKVMALFGDQNNEPLKLYQHQHEALRLLEKSTIEPFCLLLASGMASGKTEVAILHLLKLLKEKRLEPGGHVVVVYPTRELLNEQYIRWKFYFDGAYDLGYLSSKVEVVKLYGELAKTKPFIYQSEKEKIEKWPSIVLTTAATFSDPRWINRLDKELTVIPSLIIFDEIHFYSAFDLTLLLEGLRFVFESYSKPPIYDRPLKVLMFSATMGGLDEFTRNLKNYLGIEVRSVKGEPVRGKGFAYIVNLSNEDERFQESCIKEILEDYKRRFSKDKTLVFAKNRREAELVYEKFLGWKIAALHIGDMEERERKQAIRHFRKGERKFMITVKTLEVGLDIGDVSRIIHLGLPPTLNDFMQREGRIGRRGQEFESIIVVRDSGEAKKIVEWFRGVGYEPT